MAMLKLELALRAALVNPVSALVLPALADFVVSSAPAFAIPENSSALSARFAVEG